MGRRLTTKLFTISFSILWAATALHASYKGYQKTQFLGYWSKEKTQVKRIPASQTDLSRDAINLYRDYFSYDEFHKYLSYEISLELLNNGHEEKLQEALEESLIGKNTPQPYKSKGIERLQTGLKGLLKEELLPKLIINLSQKIKGEQPVQLNLDFTSKISPEFNFKRELASTTSVHWGEKGELTEKLSLTKSPLHFHVFETSLPAQTQYYQYHGGQVTLWYSPQEKKGFIRYRRFFRSPDLAKAKSFINEDEFRINLIHFKPLETKVPGAYKRGRFVTTDIYQSFSEEGMNPKLERAEIFFGKLLPTHYYEKNLATSLYGYNENVIQSDQLNLHGVLKHEGQDLMFTTEVEKLVYDFNKKEFTAQSKLRSELKGKESINGEIQQRIYYRLLKKNVIDLIQGIGLRQIYGHIGEES